VRSRVDGLSPKDLNRVSALIYGHAGIKIDAEKKIMLESRLKRRMTELKLDTYHLYCEYLFSDGRHEEEELIPLIDAVSTNKTDFFREKNHFDFLVAKALPELCGKGRSREILIWSAGCSTGEEPYTMAIVLSEYARTHSGFQFKILATDISTAVLAKAEQAVFTAQVVSPVDLDLRKKYFLRHRDRDSKLLRVVPELRATVEFRRLNLMEDFALPEKADIIFCRNVIIYFDRPTQEKLFTKFARQLNDDGYIFIGHSESLNHMDVPLVSVAPAVYRKGVSRHRK
jgi:chemotaxis protein methyltransferase CheR